MSIDQFKYSLPDEIDADLNLLIDDWNAGEKVTRIWQKDATLWTDSGEQDWLGWLDIVEHELAEVNKYTDLKTDIDNAGFTDILLMGMGGSSLCPEVFAKTFDKHNFHILDSTVPAQVLTIESKLDIAKTLFIVASKSGSTLEPNCFMQYFYEKVAETVGKENAGKHFMAITDPGSKMEQTAEKDGFRHIILGKPDVGGRFSALSPFGMTAAALMGLKVENLLKNANKLVQECKQPELKKNSGALLGAILGICHKHGRDKLTISTSPEIASLGAWLEQLIAESTGKNGVAIIPIDGELPQPAVSYAADRVFVNIRLESSDETLRSLSVLRANGHPVIDMEFDTLEEISAEFFRWEFATAVAGAVMGINPFDQPDVESAKIETRKITDEFERTGSLPSEAPFFEDDDLRFFAGEDYSAKLLQMVETPSAEALMSAHISNIDTNDYFAVLGYIEMNSENEFSLQSIRSLVLGKNLTATSASFGPRFLHSTGQAYKGGANNGVFLQVTADDDEDLAIPGQKYTFGIVRSAQERGDFQVLTDRGRRALRIHIKGELRSGLEKLMFLTAGETIPEGEEGEENNSKQP